MKNLNLVLKVISFFFLVNTNIFAWESNDGGFIELDLNKDFTLIYGGSGTAVKGDFGATGNTIMDGTTSTTYFAGSSPTMISQDATLSALGSSDKNQNSSSAPLSLPSYVTADHIIWAGLFWQGQIHDAASNTSEVDTDVNGWNTVRMRTPDDTIHTITSPIGNNTDAHSTYHYAHVRNGRYRYFHSSYVDVTNIVKAGGYTSANNTFTVGNLMATDGTDGSSNIYFNHINEPAGAWYNLRMGHFGGWSLIVAYDVDADTAQDNPNDVKYNSISIYNGFDLFSFWTGNAGDRFETTLDLGGFRTPSSGTISSKMLFFGGGGDYGMDFDTLQIEDGNNPGTFINLTNSRNQGTQLFNGTYTNLNNDILAGKSYFQGMDLDIFDASSAMAHEQTSTKIKFGVVQQSGFIDQVFPQIIAFSTELYIPKMCYDYAYKQYDRYFTEDNNGSYSPRIIGEGLDTSEPITVELFFQNIEDSDIMFKNVTVDVYDISPATYVSDTTFVINPGQVFPEQYNTLTGIPVDNIDSEDYFYLDYDLNIPTSDINMSLRARLNYEIVFSDGSGSTSTIPYTTDIGSHIPLCSNSNFEYIPRYGTFNVEDAALAGVESDTAGQLYNLPTQTANRPGTFKVASYEKDALHTRQNITTSVTIEMIDAGKYHGIDASCHEPDSALTPRMHVYFDGNVSLTGFDASTIQYAIDHELFSDFKVNGVNSITSPDIFYRNARENTAFRISYRYANNGGIELFEEVDCGNNNNEDGPICYRFIDFPDTKKTDFGNGKNRCLQSLGNGTDTVSSNCGNAGTAGAAAMSKRELATCKECLFGYNIGFVCSRDNFATRPESFRMSLRDQEQNVAAPNIPLESPIALNNDLSKVHDSSLLAPDAHHIVAGYNYALEVNATNHENDNATPGYDVSFPLDGNASNRTFKLAWQQSPTNDSNCNDVEDHNKTLTFFSGRVDLNISSAQVGKYNLTLTDKLWTRVDWDNSLMTHHTGDHFLTGDDCILGTSSVPTTGTSTTISGESLMTVSGCDITSNAHSNINASAEYTDIPLRVHPYQFNHSGITPTVGPSNKTFVYIDTPPTMDVDNTDMSYNMNGTFFAAGYLGIGSLSNFVTGCYADDLNMDLNFTYNSPEPPSDKEPFLSYSLKDHNTTDDTDIYRPVSGNDFEVGTHNSSTTAFIIAQGEEFFAKPMEGAITMDLGYNFIRDYNKTLNPRYIEFHDFNITYVTNPTGVKANMESDYQIFGNKPLDTNITFVYGRSKPSQYFYDDVTANSINTPISIVVYCDQDSITCSAVYNIIYGITDAPFGKTDEYNWYLSLDHAMDDNDGNITLIANNGAAVTSPVDINDSGGIDPNIIVSDADGTPRPLTVNIDFVTTNPSDTNRWLIYNKSKNEIPSPFYRVRFIGESGWAGHGDTGHVVDSDTSTKKNRRLGW